MAFSIQQIMQAGAALSTASQLVEAAASAMQDGQLPTDLDAVTSYIVPHVETAMAGFPITAAASSSTIRAFAALLGSIALDTVAARRAAA
jgi:hypothetical protein